LKQSQSGRGGGKSTTWEKRKRKKKNKKHPGEKLQRKSCPSERFPHLRGVSPSFFPAPPVQEKGILKGQGFPGKEKEKRGI